MTNLPGASLSAKLLQTPEIQARLKKIKLLLLDVDGVMTDGRIFWIESQGWTRQFNVKDGYGLKLLMAAGIQVGIISGGKSKDVETRAAFLKVHHVFLGDENKIVAFDKIVAATGLKPDEIAFVGDDLFDIPVLERVGFSATVPHAVNPVKERVHYITETEGGAGAVREVADAIRKAQGHGPY
ncbi:MAG: HAD hydrolase family protein [Bdellovibrionales bacterium]|nr:HAD hydrolase family protein [Bdellovibrionales bacterium]